MSAEVCPTCGSDSPQIRNRVYYLTAFEYCPDPWHDEQPEQPKVPSVLDFVFEYLNERVPDLVSEALDAYEKAVGESEGR